jgi:Fe-Mn family superoxide dismutase
MTYEKKNFEYLLGLPGFSDNLLNIHLGLYEGYVKNVQKIAESILKLAEVDKLDTPEYAELKRRLGWEWNGMRLHEYYFSNLATEKKEFNQDSALMAQIKKDFGSFENWERYFRATGAMRGIGWVILYFDPAVQKLFNVWIGEHDTGHFAGAIPLLVMDVFEHAYFTDYGSKRPDYIEAFMKAVDWEVVSNRYDMATKYLETKPKDIDHLGCRC